MSDEIKEMLRSIIDTGEEVYSILCTVSNIDKVNKICDCSPINGGADILEVKIIADNKKGLLIIPKDGSVVIVTMTSKETGYVAMFSEIEEIQLNGDNYDGVPKVKKLVGKYNNLENSLNDLKQLLTAWAPVPNDGGAALKSILATWLSQTLSVTVQDELENKTVKHGNG